MRAPPAPAAPTRRAMLAAVVVVTLAWSALWGPVLFTGRVFVQGDAPTFRAFAETSRARWFEHRERTFFSPYVFAGLPTTASLADPRPQWLPDALLDLWEAPGRHPAWPALLPALLLQWASMIALGALACALWRGGAATFVAAALAWGLASFACLPLAYGHDAQFVSLAWIPIALLCVQRLFAAASRRGIGAATLGLALACGLLGLAAHPQYKIYGVALVLAFALERALSLFRPARVALAVLAVIAGAALSAAVWWPALLYRAQSVRAAASGGVGLDEVARWSLAARDAWSFVWPDAVGFGGAAYRGGLAFAEYPPYLGLAALALAWYGRPRRRERGAACWAFWVLTGLLALGLAFGTRLGPSYAWLYHHVPLWSSLRVAVATVAIAQVAVALLAARGVARLEAAPSRGPRRGLAFAAVALIALDLARVSVPVLARAAGPRSALDPPPPSALALVAAGDPHARVGPFDKPAFLSNDAQWWGMRSLGGLHGAAPGAWNRMRESNLLGQYGLLCALGVRWVASDTLALDDPGMFAPVPDVPGVHRVLHALPRAYGVARVESPGNERAVFAALAADDFRPEVVAYTSDASAVGSYPGSANLRWEWIEDAADAIELAVRAPADAFVVIADGWFPGWRATIDGMAAPVHRVDGMLRGIAVPAGDHRLRLTYLPDGWGAAVATSRAAWLAAAAVALVLAGGAARARRRWGVA